MTFERARAIADAVLMEGYALYPYRASAPKNRFRWTFGVLAPRAWSEAGGCEPWWLEAQVLVAGAPRACAAQVRAFQVERHTGDVTWDEGVLRTLELALPEESDEDAPFAVPFALPEERAPGRERREVAGRILARRERISPDLEKLSIRVENLTPWAELGAPREQAMLGALASVHVVISAHGGELISAVDPRSACCTSTGVHPVLLGAPGSSDLALAAPFIMQDHPQVAPESAGDLCDACEIDELLVLRTRLMTDAEKAEARRTDARAAAIVDRADGLPAEWLERMHGAARELHEGEMLPKPLAVGAKVRLLPPARRTDAQDLLYAGHVATIVEIKDDVDGTRFYGVTVDDDPAAELHRWYGRCHYYRADEVDPL